MHCQRCTDPIPHGDEQLIQGQTLCEDCAIVALSPPKPCDPWAVHSAKSFAKSSGGRPTLTPPQARIIEALQQHGSIEATALAAELDMPPPELDREIATLRHMEKVRGELRQGKKYLRPW